MQDASRRLFFARDPLGRRSLLIHHPREEHPYFILSSTSTGPSSTFGEFEELSSKHIYYLDLNADANVLIVRWIISLMVTQESKAFRIPTFSKLALLSCPEVMGLR